MTSPTDGVTPERWQRVKSVLNQALDCASDERPALLDRACVGDDDLRSRVERLLESASRADSTDFLEKPPALVSDFAASVATEDGSALIAELSAALGNGYRVERELGGGGMARVFVASELALERDVVVKVLSPERAHRVSAERFAREWRLQAKLQQPNIVGVLAVGGSGSLAYYIMPYVKGESLRQRLSLGVPTPPAEALDILKDVAKALAFAHRHGVVHRDIKPENVLLSGRTAQVTDFGIAKAVSAARPPAGTQATGTSITGEGIALGTPLYMAPEQSLGDPDVGPAADVYSFGVMAYELLAGEHPFPEKRTYHELRRAHAVELPRALGTRRPELPPRLTSLVMRCLQKEPEARFIDGASLFAELDAVGPMTLGTALDAEREDTEALSIAVLPLPSPDDAPENEYFSDGIAGEVLRALTHLRGVRVAARSSSFAFKGQRLDSRVIAGRLGVSNLLEVSVQRSGKRVAIGVDLVSASDGMVVWSETYNRELADIFAVQNEIAHAIAVALEKTLARGARGSAIEGTVRGRHGKVKPDAFELYLRGRHLLEQRAQGMREALQCFEQAIALDPEFAAPYAGKSTALTLFGWFCAQRPREAFPRARKAAERALELDPTDALAHVMRAHSALWHEWDFALAESIARRALDLAPGFYLAHDCLGFVLAAQGQFEDAIAAFEQARQLDPLSENATYDLAWILMLAGRWDQAIRELEPAVARHPRSSELRRVLGFCLLYSGRPVEARTEFARVLELSVGDRWGTPNYVQSLVALGEIDEAKRLLSAIELRASHEPIPVVMIAVAHHCLGNTDLALSWLERAIEARDPWLVMLRFDPSMKELRGDVRFQSLMQRVTAEPAR